MAEYVRAIVQKVEQEGHHGAFVVTSHTCSKYRGSITFSLHPNVWKERRWPQPGEVVILSDFIEKRSGWRAESAKFSTQSESPVPTAKSKPGNILDRLLNAATSVRFYGDTASAGHIRQINHSLLQVTEEERFRLTRDLFRLWVEGKQRYEEARQVFGDLFKFHGRKPLTISHNADRSNRQFVKVWHGLPTLISAGEVGGTDCLLAVSGSTAVDRYLREFLKIYPIRKSSLTNGARIWINWG